MHKLSHHKLRELAGLCAGVALLAGVAAAFSGNIPFLPEPLQLAIGTIRQTAKVSNTAAVAYWQTQNGNYGGYPSPTSCSMNYQNPYSGPNCFQNFPGGILSAVSPGTGAGTYTYGTYNIGGYAPCYPTTGRWYSGGFGSANTTGPLSIPYSTSVQLDWSCQPSQYVSIYLACGDGWEFPSANIYSSSYVTDSLGNTYSAGSNPLIGTANVIAPGTIGQIVNYNLYCNGILNATVPVKAVIPTTPTATLNINGSGDGVSTTSYSGSPSTVVVNYGPGYGDTLAATAINGTDGVTSVPCANISPYNSSCWTQPDATKTYTFTPTAGTYTFYATEKTLNYPYYNNYRTATLTVVDRCPNGSGPTGSCTSCNVGYVPQGGNCVLQCPNGSGPTGSCSSCNTGYVLSGGTCTLQCPNGSGPTGSCSSCNTGYIIQGTIPNRSCVSAGGTINLFSISTTKVRKNISTPVTFSWNVLAPPAPCTISGPSGFTPLAINPVSGVLGQQASTVTLSQTSTFTLSCGALTSQVTVGLLPYFQEI